MTLLSVEIGDIHASELRVKVESGGILLRKHDRIGVRAAAHVALFDHSCKLCDHNDLAIIAWDKANWLHRSV